MEGAEELQEQVQQGRRVERREGRLFKRKWVIPFPLSNARGHFVTDLVSNGSGKSHFRSATPEGTRSGRSRTPARRQVFDWGIRGPVLQDRPASGAVIWSRSMTHSAPPLAHT